MDRQNLSQMNSLNGPVFPSALASNHNNNRQEQISIVQPKQHSIQRNCWNMQMSALLIAFSLVSFGQIPSVEGLSCYQTDENGKLTIVQDDTWAYCALVPSMGDGNANGSQFGLGAENDMLAMYNTAFATSQEDEDYRILTLCIFERYDFGRFMRIRLDLAVEFAFRCVCNFDLCNSEPTFSAYLTALKSSKSIAKK